MATAKHKKNASRKINVGIITVSTTRTLENDKSGQWMAKLTAKEGHKLVFHRVVSDDSSTITQTVLKVMRDNQPDVLLISGGTGISKSDVTIEAVRPLLTKELSAFGPVFAQLSFEQIDSSAILSRATAGVAGKTIIFCMPGSLNACKLACKAIIFPELGHLINHLGES
jgi:molybdenum cofactor biosynthesis protein B